MWIFLNGGKKQSELRKQAMAAFEKDGLHEIGCLICMELVALLA